MQKHPYSLDGIVMHDGLAAVWTCRSLLVKNIHNNKIILSKEGNFEDCFFDKSYKNAKGNGK